MTHKKQLLIVDDEPGVLLVLEHYLAESFDVHTAENGRQAIQWIDDGHVPDLALVDIEMPVMDGYELLRRLRARPDTERMPCLMVSGKNKNLHYLQALRMGADGFIAKPFTAAEIKNKVEHFAETIH
jgi:CheY-like chemotaxis protein